MFGNVSDFGIADVWDLPLYNFSFLVILVVLIVALLMKYFVKNFVENYIPITFVISV